MSYQQFSLVFGFSVWLFATLVFSFFGQHFFIHDNLLIMILFYVGVIPILYGLMDRVFSKYQLSKEDKMKSSILLALPGMLLDTFCLRYHHFVFPSFSSEQVTMLGSWIIWVYTIVLFLGIGMQFLSTNSKEYSE